MAFTIDYKEFGASVCFTGPVKGPDLLEAKTEFFAHRFDSGPRYVICDFTDATQFDIATEDLNRLVEQDNQALPEHPVLFELVVAQKPVMYGLARMWQSKVDRVRPHTAVLRTRDEAVEWLRAAGVSPAPEHCVAPKREEAIVGGTKKRSLDGAGT